MCLPGTLISTLKRSALPFDCFTNPFFTVLCKSDAEIRTAVDVMIAI